MAEKVVVYQKFNWEKLEKISFLLIYALFAFYFLINGEGLFKEWDQSWTWITIIYLVGVSLFLGINEEIPQELEEKLEFTTIGFLASFLVLTMLFIVLHDFNLYFVDVTPISIKLLLPTLIFQLVIVVSSEEIIFRGVLLRYFYKYFGYLVAVLGTAIVFSLFHLVAYEGSIGSLLTAFLMGIILAVCTFKFNIGVALGIHACWNCYILGVTAF